MKTHEFRLEVKTTDTRQRALFRVLSKLLIHAPKGYLFFLKNLPPDSASRERAAIKRRINAMLKCEPMASAKAELEHLAHWIDSREPKRGFVARDVSGTPITHWWRTENTSASVERASLKRFITRHKRTYHGIEVVFASDALRFINTRTARTAARQGGLGRK